MNERLDVRRARVMIWLLRLRGRWRLWRGCCPQCNSSVPDLYSCPVCEGYYPPTLELRTRWWKRFEREVYIPPGYREFIRYIKEEVSDE